MAMVRYQIFMDEGQKRMLDEMHRRLNMPVAERVRKAIDRLLAEQTAETVYPPVNEQTDSMFSLAGVCEGGPSDMADNHEQYLRGDKLDISFADFTSFVVMKELRITDAFTGGRHYELVGMGLKKLF